MNYNRITDFKNRDKEGYTAATEIERVGQSREYTEDYILPDYLPDAKKVLEFDCRPIIESRFVGNCSVEYTGSVNCRVLYLSEQSELGVAVFTVPFEDKLSNDEITDDCVDIILPKVYSSSCRLQNPRKFNVRLKAGADIDIWKRRSYMPELYGSASGEDEHCLETNPVIRESVWVLSSREDEMTLSEDLTLDKSMADIDRVILSRAEVVFDECRCGSNEIICKGSCSFECLYKGNDGQYWFFRKNIPMSENITAPNIGDGGNPVVYANCKFPDVNVREDEFGQKRILELDVDYGVEAVSFNPKKIWFTSDSYSTVKEVQNSVEDTVVYSNHNKIAGGLSVNESVGLEDIGLGADEKIISYSCTPILNLSSEVGKKGKMMLVGECVFSVLAEKKDNSIYPLTFKLPIKIESDCSMPEKGEWDGRALARASNIRVRTDNEKLYTDFELSFCVAVIVAEKLPYLESIRILPASQREFYSPSTLILCYPQNGDDEWKIAKKYRITREDLAEQNGMIKEMPDVLRIPTGVCRKKF